MEIALIAGVGFLGKVISDSNKSKTQVVGNNLVATNIYNSDQVVAMRDERAKIARNNRELSKDPERTNIIPPLYPQSYFKQPIGVMGALTEDTVSDISDNFNNQFKTSKWTRRPEFVAANEQVKGTDGRSKFLQNEVSAIEKWTVFDQAQDMTYAVVDKKDMTFENMEHFTKQRDYNVYNDYNEQRSPLAIELFTGSSKNYFSKRETENFFDPAKDVSFVNGMPAITNAFQDRYADAVKLERRNERPFEPRQIGPGLRLSVDQDSMGGLHDTTRVLPKGVNELRRADLPRESKTLPVNHGMMGENTPVLTAWKKRLPEKFRQLNGSDLIPGSSQATASAVRENFNLLLGNRAFSKEEVGPALAAVAKFTNDAKGIVKLPNRNLYIEPGVSNAKAYIAKINQNTESFQKYANQRSKTNINRNKGGVNPVTNNHTVRPEDTAKTTSRETLDNMPTKGISQSHIQALKAKFIDDAKPTLRQMTVTKTYEGPANVSNSKTAAYIGDDIKVTGRQQIITEETGRMFSDMNKASAYAYETPDATLRQMAHEEQRGNAALNKSMAVYNFDEPEATVRQMADEYDYTAPGGANTGNVAYNEEEMMEQLDLTMKDITKVRDYLGTGGTSTSVANRDDYHNAHTNETREVVSKGRVPTKVGQSKMATLENTQVGLKHYQNNQRQWVATATQNIKGKTIDEDIRMKLVSMKDKTFFDDRLSASLNDVLLENPIVNNQIHHPFRRS